MHIYVKRDEICYPSFKKLQNCYDYGFTYHQKVTKLSSDVSKQPRNAS